METYCNLFHNSYLYLRIDKAEIDSLSPSVFEELSRKHNMPLQVMVPSDATRIVALLQKANFQLKRKCYEMEVGPSDLLSALPRHAQPLFVSHKGSPAFSACAALMYRYYQDTHAAVNPLTASPGEFFEMLPTTALYAGAASDPLSAAFLEENEIAYLCSRDPDDFSEFAQSLLRYMFEQYVTIIFEADDTDRAAMELKNLFVARDEPTFDTYVYLNRHEEHATLQ